MKLVIKCVETYKVLRLEDCEDLGTDLVREVDLSNAHVFRVVDHHDDFVDVDLDLVSVDLDASDWETE